MLEIGARMKPDGSVQGVTRVLGVEFDTTGVLGASNDRDGGIAPRAFPWWATIPDYRWLSMARSWHFFFAWILVLNGLAYLAWSIGSRHLARDLAPNRAELPLDPAVDPRPPALPASDRRGGEALQRAAEARLPRDHPRRACRS